MNRDYILDDYFDWLYFQVTDKGGYRKLLGMLHNMTFRYSIDYDENRADDGVNLRWYYVDDGGNDEILRWKNECTVLEMLLAAAIQIEKIMDDPDVDYSARHWFWMFLENLDLADMTDDVYDKTYIYGRVSMFMDRTYEPDGDGNIIYIPNIKEDLRDVEIWCQMCWYMDSIL